MPTTIKHDKEDFTFYVKQDDFPEFAVCEGNMQYLVDAYTNPEKIDPNYSLFLTFRVTEKGKYLILERSSRGQDETLMKLTPKAAKKWALTIEKVHGKLLRSYAP